MTLENIVYACYEEHKKHTTIWHYRPIDENTIEWC